MAEVILQGTNPPAKNISFPTKYPVKTGIDVTIDTFDDAQDFAILKNDTIKNQVK